MCVGGCVWEDVCGRMCVGGCVWEDVCGRMCVGGCVWEEVWFQVMHLANQSKTGGAYAEKTMLLL